ncbi:hypothetical protein LOZ80_38105 [Paenibacillus sp. HWE-109]|nr:hypothetical protein [Paenibacillus sp. HWE-109]UKS27207.1 hypothetical protein LOZ80_38105 [Paenibacillus sp. HWE-109]
MAYFEFLLNQWILGNLVETKVQTAVTKGYITTEQANAILATPKSV